MRALQAVNAIKDLFCTSQEQTIEATANMLASQVMIATTYYLHLPLLHCTYDLWHKSCDSVQECAGIVWSMSLQPITPTVIAQSPFLQLAIPTLTVDTKSVVVAQITGTWKDSKDTAAIEAVALKLIDDIDVAARRDNMDHICLHCNVS